MRYLGTVLGFLQRSYPTYSRMAVNRSAFEVPGHKRQVKQRPFGAFQRFNATALRTPGAQVHATVALTGIWDIMLVAFEAFTLPAYGLRKQNPQAKKMCLDWVARSLLLGEAHALARPLQALTAFSAVWCLAALGETTSIISDFRHSCDHGAKARTGTGGGGKLLGEQRPSRNDMALGSS